MNRDILELPPELRAELRFKRAAGLEDELAALFSDGRSRTINDTLIDYWQQHGKVLKRSSVTSSLANMAKAGHSIRRCGKGAYKAINPIAGKDEQE